MADPTEYDPSYSFSGWQASNPAKPLPAQQVDNELANISAAINGHADAIKDVRRADGKLQNKSVHLESLSDSVRAVLTNDTEIAAEVLEAAEAATEAANAAADAANAAANLVGIQFDTIAAASLATIDPSVNRVTVAGYSAPGDFGGALYKRVVAEPAHALAFQSANGVWFEIAERRVYAEMAGAKGDFDPQTQTGTDNTAAINRVFDWARAMQKDGLTTWFAGLPNFGVAFRDGAIYKVTSSINATGLRQEGMTIWGNAACLYPAFTAAKPVVDAVYSKGLWVDKLLIFADDPALTGKTAPSYGLTVGRIDDADVSGCSFSHCQFRGYFTNACFLNISGEIHLHTHCTYHNFMPTVFDEEGYTETGLCVRTSDYDVATFTSEFALPDPDYPRSAWFGMGLNTFQHCHLQSDNGVPVCMSGLTGGFNFEDTYTYTHNGSCNFLFDGFSTHNALRITGNHECGPGAVATFMFNTVGQDILLFDFYCHVQSPTSLAVFGVLDDSNPDYFVKMYSSEIHVGPNHPSYSSIKLAKTTDVKWLDFHGVFRIATDAANLHDFEAFKSFKGALYTLCNTPSFANIPSGYMDVYSYPRSDTVHIVTS